MDFTSGIAQRFGAVAESTSEQLRRVVSVLYSRQLTGEELEMPRFRFRLEASLRLAEIALDQELRRLAQEVQKLKQLEYERNQCENTWLQAAAGQRTAGLTSPRDLGIWQKYAEHCLKLLRLKEKEFQGQAQTVQKCREALAAAHREAEKFRRLKERQLKLFRLAEEKREQKILDEAGQVLYWQKMNVR